METHALQKNAAVTVCDTLRGALEVIRELRSHGFDLKRKVSVVSRDSLPSRSTVGYYSVGDGIRYWGRSATLWSEVWSLLAGWAFFVMPGIGPVLVAGPMAGWLIAALKYAAMFGNLSVLGAALYSIGISREQVWAYEAAARAGKCLVIVHGSSREIDKVRTLLESGATLESGIEERGAA